MKHHPISELFPMMDAAEYEALREDIRRFGLREPVVFYEGAVLDGRNRLRACLELGVSPETRIWDGDGSAVAFVISKNLHRRHLTSSQRAACAVSAMPHLEEEAKERQREHGGTAPGLGKETLPQKVGEVKDRHAGEATQQAAEIFGTNRQYVAVAEKVKERDPELFERVKSGEVPIQGALRAIRGREEAEAKAEVEDDLRSEMETADRRYRVDQGDCLEWFAAQPADSIDLVFGSPPYEDARLYLEDGSDLGIALGTDAWVTWMVEVYRAALRCCTGLVGFVVEGRTKDYQWTASPALLMAALRNAGIAIRKPPVYHRVGIPGSGGPDWLRNDYEFIVCATRGGRLPWSDNTAMGDPCVYEPGGDPSHRLQDGSRVNSDGVGFAPMGERNNVGPHRARQRAGRVYEPPEIANPGNVIRCAVGGGNMGSRLSHENEAPFPESLAEFLIRSFCPPGGVVCDPFSGSGTTGAMALQYGRRFLGCDLRESQVRISRRRMANVTPPLPTIGV
jgi:hypothetical protein